MLRIGVKLQPICVAGHAITEAVKVPLLKIGLDRVVSRNIAVPENDHMLFHFVLAPWIKLVLCLPIAGGQLDVMVIPLDREWALEQRIQAVLMNCYACPTYACPRAVYVLPPRIALIYFVSKPVNWLGPRNISVGIKVIYMHRLCKNIVIGLEGQLYPTMIGREREVEVRQSRNAVIWSKDLGLSDFPEPIEGIPGYRRGHSCP